MTGREYEAFWTDILEELAGSVLCSLGDTVDSNGDSLDTLHFPLVAQLVKNLPAMWETWV